MILARLSAAAAYRGIHPNLDLALDHLTPGFLSTVTGQRQDLKGDEVYVTRFDYETVPFEETFFESHRLYLDIHLLTRGEERVDLANPAGLEEYTHEGDFWGYHGEAEQQVHLKAGDFLVVFPGDAHRLKIRENGPSKVSKVVFKVRIAP